MTAKDAMRIAQGFTRLSLWNYFAFLALSLVFGGLTVLSPEIHETLAYADMRKVMTIGYTLPAVTMLLIALYLTGRSNAALRFAEAAMPKDPEAESTKSAKIFKPLSTLWSLFFMTALIITVNYIVLIYAVDGGIF